MEYLDGEDLDSLLRRIGRLPQDKAIEFARKICAGLAAAHERGVLHRDLKPSNIMIDGRGQVRIADFGLAALAAEIPLSDLRSGTPAYMSPEQKAGREVTTRSDLYSLGLVLYEMFTGKRRTNTDTNPTDLVKDLDPTVERVILRCLEEDPKRRPSSALSVAMALPGGDPIAAALAAGETPSPEMVAASGEKEGFSPRTAVLCFAGGIALLISSLFMIQETSLLGSNRAEINIPADALAFRAQDVLKQLGYAEQPRSAFYAFDCCDQANLLYIENQTARRDSLLSSHQPAVIRFWYRQHQGQLLADLATDTVTYDLPANLEPGMIRLALDAKGRLIAFDARPEDNARPKDDATGAPATPPFDWSKLFTAASLDMALFTSVAPEHTPPMAFDSRAAWTGTYAQGRPERIRVEAAAWQGKPVFLDIAGDWRPDESTSPASRRSAVLVFALLCVIAGAVLIAWRNLRLGRSDWKGAGKLAAYVFVSSAGAGLLTTTHVASPWEFRLLVSSVSTAAFISGLVWLAYIAVEPYARRNWPDSLISWNRVLAGRFRDPLIASHVLAGFIAFWAAGLLVDLVSAAVSAAPIAPPTTSIQAMNGVATFAGGVLASVGYAPVQGMAFLVLAMLARLLLRKVWIADLVAALLLSLSGIAVDTSNPYRLAATSAAYVLFSYAFFWLLRRFGFLAVVSMWLMNNLVAAGPYTSLTSWYGGRMMLASGIGAVIAAWALWVILSAPRRSEFTSAPG